MRKYLATKGDRSYLPPMSYFESPNKGDGSDLACNILAVELVQLQAVMHKAVQNYTKRFRLLSCRFFLWERTRQVFAEALEVLSRSRRPSRANATAGRIEKKKTDAWKRFYGLLEGRRSSFARNCPQDNSGHESP